MGEYECCSCNKMFHLDEPPWDGLEMCDKCREDNYMNDQDKFLDELERLCGRYSSRGMWEWRVGSEDRDGIHFKFFYVDVENTEEKDSK